MAPARPLLSSRAGATLPGPRRAGLAALALAAALAAPAARATPAPSPYAPAIATARAALQRMVDRGEVPGVAAAVAVDGAVVWSEGFGWADVEERRPATAETRFGFGSVSKTLTAAAAVALADAGRLDLDAPVERLLADFPHPGRGITLRRLLVHQSGLGDAVASGLYSTTERFPTLAAAYRLYLAEKLAFPPGTKAEYATGTYTLAGRALELAAGQGFAELLAERILKPAGMTATAPLDPAAADPLRSRFYVAGDGGRFVPGPPFDPSHKLPGAGYAGTAADLARFGAALAAPGGLLSERGREEMFRPVPLADGTPTDYALGFRVKRDDGRRLLHQPGGGIGISCWLFVFPDDGLALAILSNVTGGPVGGGPRKAISDAFFAARASRAPAQEGDRRSPLQAVQPANP